MTAPVRYAVQVTDVDGQRLERPIEGVIRIQADLPPRIAAGIVTQYVLPTARPTVYLQALDDYGLATVSMLCEIAHPDGQTEQRTIDIYRLEPGKRPLGNIDMGYPFELAQLKLKKGDRLKVTLQAVDYRGQREGKTATADPLVFQVTDEQGILAGMMEADRQSATQLKTMIQRQLGIGESP